MCRLAQTLGVMESPPAPNRRYLKRRENEAFWQFQYEHEPFKESRSFYDKDFGSKEGSLDAACKHRDEFFAAAKDIGVIDSDGKFYIRPIPIQLKISPRNKSGIIGVAREVSVAPAKASPEKVWIANFKNSEGEHDQKSYSIRVLGEKGALLAALTRRIEYVQSVLDDLISTFQQDQVKVHLVELLFLREFIDTLVDEDEIFVLLSTLNNPLLSPTEKHDFLARRIGQARFRKMVLARCGDRCVVTGAVTFLTAGHLKPWSESTDEERMDPHNGLAFFPVYDKAFDAGYITFDDFGKIVISSLLRRDAKVLGISGDETISTLSQQSLCYLAYHRNHRYRR